MIGVARAVIARSAAASPAWQQILDLAADDGWTAVYDPTNPNTRTLRESGGTFFFSAIADGMGNGPDITQATEANQLTLSEGAFGDLDAAVGNSDQWLVSADYAAPIAQPFAFALVHTADEEASFYYSIAQGSTSADARYTFGSVASGVDEWQLNAGTSLGVAGVDLLPHVHMVLANGASSWIRIDATERATGDVGTGSATRYVFGARGNLVNAWRGPLGVQIMRETVPTTGEIDRMEDLLHSLSGIAKAP